MSLITRIQKDHEQITNFYQEYEKFRAALSWDEATRWYNQFAWEVARHSASEEVVVYPFMEKHAIGNVAQNRLEHQLVKEDLAKIQSLDIQRPEFHALMQKVIKALEDHMANEEKLELPALAKVTSVEKLDKLGTPSVPPPPPPNTQAQSSIE